MNDINSLSHSKWRCKYHIVFAPKYRRQAIYGDIRKDIGVILRKLCEQKKVEIVEAELCSDHIHGLTDPCNKVSFQVIQTWYKPSPMDNFDHYTMKASFRRQKNRCIHRKCGVACFHQCDIFRIQRGVYFAAAFLPELGMLDTNGFQQIVNILLPFILGA